LTGCGDDSDTPFDPQIHGVVNWGIINGPGTDLPTADTG
jgi:hypothetical protein